MTILLNFDKEPGRAEADFGRFDVKTVVRNIYILFSQSEMQIANKDQEIMDLVKPSTPLPPWLPEDDLANYAALYEKPGFQTALQVPYMTLDAVGSEVQDPKVEAPTLLILGEDDYAIKIPGLHDFIKSAEMKKYVPTAKPRSNIYPSWMPFCARAIPRQGQSNHPRFL